MSLPGYDAWATGGRYSRLRNQEVFCWNPKCADYGEVNYADYEQEYGAGWYSPEECPKCGGEWHDTEPVPADEEEDTERGVAR